MVSFNITVARNGSENIENAASDYTMSVDGQSIIVTTDGTDWFIAAHDQ